MKIRRTRRPSNARKWRRLPVLVLLLLAELSISGCKRSRPLIALIPRTCCTALLEPEHAGAAEVAHSRGLDIYWNALMRDDDTQTQISLLAKAQKRGRGQMLLLLTRSGS